MNRGIRCALLVGLVGWSGCGSNGLPTVFVSGTLKIDGRAVEGVEVQFVSANFAAVGKTDAEGKFQLNPGAMPGPNKVCFRKFDVGQFKDDPDAGMDAGQFAAMQQAQGSRSLVKQLIPREYTDSATTKIEFIVPLEGTSAADFDLQSGL